MTETIVSVGPRGKGIAIGLIGVVVALNLFVPPIGTSLAANVLSAVVIAALLIVISRGNPRARVIGLGVLAVLGVLVAMQAAVA